MVVLLLDLFALADRKGRPEDVLDVLHLDTEFKLANIMQGVLAMHAYLEFLRYFPEFGEIVERRVMNGDDACVVFFFVVIQLLYHLN